MILLNAPKEEIYWLAGLIEGEGCFYQQARYVPIFVIAMSDVDVIHKVSWLLDGATQSFHELNKRKMYRVTISGAKAIKLMLIMYPLMGNRRRIKIKEILTDWYNRPTKGRQINDPKLKELVYQVIQ